MKIEEDICNNCAYVYIIRCEDNSLYTGIAKNVEKRMEEHFYQKKKCARYTKVHKMMHVEAVFKAEGWSEAGKLEYVIKGMKKGKKEELVKNPEQINQFVQDKLTTFVYTVVDKESIHF